MIIQALFIAGYTHRSIAMAYGTPEEGPHPIYPETLGKPSEVFSFTVEGITRTNIVTSFIM